MDENKKNLPEEEEKQSPEKTPDSPVTRLYDKIPVTLRQLNIFIAVLVGLLLMLLIYGIIKGNL